MFRVDDIKNLSGITSRDEMIKAVSKIPDEDVRTALIFIALSWNQSVKINEEVLIKEREKYLDLEKKYKELEEKLMK